MCNREYQEAGGDTSTAQRDPETNSAYGATVGKCTFIRIDRAGGRSRRAEPDTRGPRGRGRGPRCDRHGDGDPGSFGPGKYTAPNALNQMKFHYPCPADKIPFDGTCIIPEGDAFPIPAG